MMFVKGELCYSPHPPESYGKGGKGHGPYFADDMQLWNLLYLSVPKLDLYLTDGADAVKVWYEIDIEHVAACSAMLKGDACKRLFPEMRGLLKHSPEQFVCDVSNHRGLHAMPTYIIIPQWLRVMEERVGQISGGSRQHMIDLFNRIGVTLKNDTH